MPRVALGVQGDELAAGKTESVAIVCDVDAICIDRHQSPVDLARASLAVHGLGACPQLRRVDHVGRAARVQHATGIRQVRQQFAGAAGVVEVHVREKDGLDVAAIQPCAFERIEQERHGVVGAGVHERRAPGLDN